jgi:CheY-like chemotaxis protein
MNSAAKVDANQFVGVKVLVAEDNTVNQLVITSMLSKLGCAVFMASNGAEAVELFTRERPDIVLTDISMPVMDGVEATKRIRDIQAQFGLSIPIVGVTAHAMADDRQRCLDAGMDDHLPKPVKPAPLRDLLLRWLGPAASCRQAG